MANGPNNSGSWLGNLLGKDFMHALKRVGHAQQLRPDFERAFKEICEYLRLDTNEFKQYKEPLENFLGLREDLEKGMPDEDLILRRMQRGLPSFDYAPAVSFERFKEPKRLAEKLFAEDRDTYDTHGKQLWLADPALIRKLASLENPQHPLRKRWAERD